jgi:hypothetical protein
MKKLFSLYMACGLFTLTLLLTACSGTDNTQASTPTTTTSNQTTPTVAATSTQNSNYAFLSYTGKGYTINYPPMWAVKPDDSNGATFTNPSDKSAVLHVIVNDHSEAALQIEEGTSLKDRCKRSGNVPETVTINGVTWNQGEYRCSAATADGSDQEIRTLDMTKPVGNTYYSIAFYATPQNFDNTVKHSFQTMIESFKAR